VQWQQGCWADCYWAAWPSHSPTLPVAGPPPASQVDLAACARRGIRVVRVPAYSPRSVAEHAFAMAFALAR
jgi:hypothetical protein